MADDDQPRVTIKSPGIVRDRTNTLKINTDAAERVIARYWPAPGSEDTEFGVLMEPEVRHGEAEVYAGVQA